MRQVPRDRLDPAHLVRDGRSTAAGARPDLAVRDWQSYLERFPDGPHGPAVLVRVQKPRGAAFRERCGPVNSAALA